MKHHNSRSRKTVRHDHNMPTAAGCPEAAGSSNSKPNQPVPSSEELLQEQICQQEKYLNQLNKLQAQNAVFEQRALIIAKELERQVADVIVSFENVRDNLHNLGRPIQRSNVAEHVTYVA